MLYNQHPPIMMESDVDQLGLMLETIERLATLDADLVLCGHGDPGSNLTQRCAQVIDCANNGIPKTLDANRRIARNL